eukprot:403337641
MWLSKRKIKLIKIFLVSPCLEKILLLSYLVLFPILIAFASYEGNSQVDNYDIRKNLLKYYDQPKIINANSYQEVYDYVDLILHEKLWVNGRASPYQPIGTLRMAQFRVESDCTSEEIRQPCSDISCFKKMYSVGCNRLFIANSTEAKTYTPSNQSLCATHDCFEYNYTDTKIKFFQGSFGLYGESGYYLDFSFNKTQNQQKLNSLSNEEWLDFNTRAICLQWTVRNIWSETYYISTVFIENPANRVFTVSFRIQTAYIYHKGEEDSSKVQVIVFYTFFLLNILLFAGKVVMELSLGINKVTNFVEILNLTLCSLAVSARISSIGVLVENSSFENSYQEFQTFATQASLHQFEIITLGTASLFYPFRAFQFFAHFKFFKPMRIYLNTIYRIIPGIGTYLILVITLYVCWAQSFYLVFSPYIKDFRNYFQSILTVSYKRFYDTQEFQDFTSNRDFSYMELAGLIQNWCNTFIFFFFIAMITALYKKAVGFEKGAEIITPEKQAFKSDIQEIKEKVNQIYIKKVKGRDESEVSMQLKNKKIVLWLINRKKNFMRAEREQLFQRINQELIEEQEFQYINNYYEKNRKESANYYRDPRKHSSSFGPKIIKIENYDTKTQTNNVQVHHYQNAVGSFQQIQFIDFENFKQLKNFLDSFFKLKPSLITSSSYDKFRIVIEDYVQEDIIQGMNKNGPSSSHKGYNQLNENFDDEMHCDHNIEQCRNQCYLKKYQLHHAQEVVDFLKEIGSKVPVLIYSNQDDIQMDMKKVMKLKKKYLMLQVSNKFNDLKRFCFMQNH